jgi:hypothetical protein
MTATATIIQGPGVVAGLGLISTWKVLMDSSSLVTGEPIDLTSVYSSVSALSVAGTDAVGDNVYLYNTVLPTDGTDISSSTVLVSASQSDTHTGSTVAAKAFAICDGVNLSTVGELRLIAIGLAVT